MEETARKISSIPDAKLFSIEELAENVYETQREQVKDI
jgi:hypothetical protein